MSALRAGGGHFREILQFSSGLLSHGYFQRLTIFGIDESRISARDGTNGRQSGQSGPAHRQPGDTFPNEKPACMDRVRMI